MEYTKNLNLKKPDVNEYYDIEKNNENMDLIDTAVGELNKKIAITKISQETIKVEAKADTGIIGSAYAYIDITNIIEDDVIYIIPISATKVGSPGIGALISKYHPDSNDPLYHAWSLAAPSEGQYNVTFLFFHK